MVAAWTSLDLEHFAVVMCDVVICLHQWPRFHFCPQNRSLKVQDVFNENSFAA